MNNVIVILIYNRVILLSLNNTVEFFKLSITIIKLLLIKTECNSNFNS